MQGFGIGAKYGRQTGIGRGQNLALGIAALSTGRRRKQNGETG
jgi:hypothetical protein